MAETFIPPSQSAFITDQSGRVTGHISLGGPELWMPCGDRTQCFEMHNYFGPMVCDVNGDEVEIDEKDSFWDAFERWSLGGKLVEKTLCVVPSWCVECKGQGSLYQRIGGPRSRSYEYVGECAVCGGKKLNPVTG